ncbi:hypothetical protein T484DRAFT_1787243 [Baffinella frigidus]|nr:hypothetical protein T484DRAFT_1787243 [Cryptophyta sp. CCMP2293]
MDPVRVAEQESLALATQRGGKQSRKMARRLKRAAALTEASAEALTQSVDQFFTSVGRGSSAWASVNYRALAGIPVGQQPSVASARERDAARSEADTLSVAGSLSARGPRSVAGSVRSHAASVHASVHASGAATAREARLATASDAGAAGPRSNHTGQRMVESFEKDMLSSHRGAICMAVPCIPSININQILAEQAAAAALLAPPLRGGEDPSGVVRTTLKMMQRQKRHRLCAAVREHGAVRLCAAVREHGAASQEMATLVQEHGAARVDPNYAPHGFQAGKARASSAFDT